MAAPAPSAACPRARTKIVATVGPASRDPQRLRELVLADVDVFRLNMAHANHEEHAANVRAIREIGRQLERPIGILADLAGPKIRLGELPGGQIDCHKDAEFRFIRGEVASKPDELVTTYEPLVDELDTGDRVMLADGTVSLVVEEKGAGFARCRVVQPGLIRSRQGVNLPGVKLSTPAMSDVDQADAIWAAEAGIDFVGLSFVRAAQDVRQLTDLLRARGSHARVIAKIEKPEALDHLEEIVQAAGGIMVARGDLGVEIDVARTAIVQKEIIATCNRHGKPVIVATQMLDSMQHSPRPTRAEVTDVANAILDGADACMLSGETAIGEYPREAVEMMHRVAVATEELLRARQPAAAALASPGEDLHRITRAVVLGAGAIAAELDAKLVVVASHSGATALVLSKQRNFVPTIGVSDSQTTLQQMSLYWGVTPLPGAPAANNIELPKFIDQWGRRDGCLAPGDLIVLVGGTGLAPSTHNAVAVHEVA